MKEIVTAQAWDHHTPPKGGRCTPQHFVLCGTYILFTQEYAVIVT